MVDDLVLITGAKVTFFTNGTKIKIKQPTLVEIAEELGGCEPFFIGCTLLLFPRETLEKVGKVDLDDLTDFDILLTILKDKSINAFYSRMILILTLSDYQIQIKDKDILLIDKQENEVFLNNDNWSDFRKILIDIFCLNSQEQKRTDNEYNPEGDRAAAIVKKLQERHRILAKRDAAKDKHEDSVIMARYISILSIGLKENVNTISQNTVYQLFDQFQRFNLYENYETFCKIKLAGGKGMDEVENWMKDLYSIEPTQPDSLFNK